ncbi:recombination-associated protein RdgC [Parashewanella tropica]|uniref:recombination-associated protein RdgC n=1 Tax=Parashewanella tropica TaxID=2547970 RepID=UPI00105A71F1|nr:recombination-associated protein RdgC [Parashewanella tropica]
MWFKNLTLYRFNKPFSIDTEQLEQALSSFSFTPCSSQDVSKLGFSKALGKLGQTLVHSANGIHLISMTKEEKLLPAQVVKEAVDEKVSVIEDQENRKVTKKEKDAFKEDVIATLLPRAFSRRSQIKALIMPEQQLVVVDSSSATKAEEMLSLLRKAIGSLPIVPVSFSAPIENTLTAWLETSEIPASFEVQDEAELKSVSEEGGIVRFKQQELFEEEVLAHIASGKQVHKLALHFGQSIAFVVQSDASLKRLKFSEEFRAINDEVGNEDPMARMDADYALMCGELKALFESLFKALGGLESEN